MARPGPALGARLGPARRPGPAARGQGTILCRGWPRPRRASGGRAPPRAPPPRPGPAAPRLLGAPLPRGVGAERSAPPSGPGRARPPVPGLPPPAAGRRPAAARGPGSGAGAARVLAAARGGGRRWQASLLIRGGCRGPAELAAAGWEKAPSDEPRGRRRSPPRSAWLVGRTCFVGKGGGRPRDQDLGGSPATGCVLRQRIQKPVAVKAQVLARSSTT